LHRFYDYIKYEAKDGSIVNKVKLHHQKMCVNKHRKKLEHKKTKKSMNNPVFSLMIIFFQSNVMIG